MNNILLFIVIAIIIIAVVALFFLQKLQKNQGRLPRPKSIDNQPTIKMADPRLLSDEDIANALSAQQAPKRTTSSVAPQPAPQNELANVDVYIQNQDYQTAINELKRLLMTNPRHTGAMLKLLQVYGLTKQYTPFNQLHQKICEIADEKTIQDASFFKSLIDEEIADVQPTPTPVATPVQINTLEFDVPTQKATIPTPTPQPLTDDVADDEIFELDFDINETDKLANQTAPTPSQHTPSQHDDVIDLGELDFGLDTLDAQKATPQAAISPTPTDDITATDNFDDVAILGQNTHQSTNTQESTANEQKSALDDGLDFDFDFSNNKPATQKTTTQSESSFGGDTSLDFSFDDKPQQDSKTTEAIDDFDFTALSLDGETTTKTTHDTATIAQADSTDDGLDFDFGGDKPSTQNEPVADTKPAFDFTLDDKAPQSTTTATDAVSTTEFDFAQLSLDDDIAPKADTTSNTQNINELDDFDFGDIPTSKQDATPTVDDFDLSIDFDTADVSFDVDDKADKADDFSFTLDTQTTDESITQPSLATTETSNTKDDFDGLANTTQTPNLDLDTTLALEDDLAVDTPIFNETKTNSNNIINHDVATDDFDWQIELAGNTSANKETTETTHTSSVADIPTTKVQEIPVVITPAPATSLEDSLSTPTDDGIQVTLALAKQYVEFGEYDSAKRLLQEVVQDGLPSQKQEAHALMITLA